MPSTIKIRIASRLVFSFSHDQPDRSTVLSCSRRAKAISAAVDTARWPDSRSLARDVTSAWQHSSSHELQKATPHVKPNMSNSKATSVRVSSPICREAPGVNQLSTSPAALRLSPCAILIAWENLSASTQSLEGKWFFQNAAKSPLQKKVLNC